MIRIAASASGKLGEVRGLLKGFISFIWLLPQSPPSAAHICPTAGSLEIHRGRGDPSASHRFSLIDKFALSQCLSTADWSEILSGEKIFSFAPPTPHIQKLLFHAARGHWSHGPLAPLTAQKVLQVIENEEREKKTERCHVNELLISEKAH